MRAKMLDEVMKSRSNIPMLLFVAVVCFLIGLTIGVMSV
jgi:hypothetical protein